MFISRVIVKFAKGSNYFCTSTKLSARRGVNRVNRYLNELNDAKDKIVEDPEAFGDLESDFMDVHKSHKQHIEEERAYNDFIRLKVVKNKYFKEKYPNFLTFAEKEQIRILNSSDPEEWIPEKLAESFPADEETIIKLLKAKWYPRNEKRLYKHDEKVMENWEKFRKGEFLEIPPQLKEHLEKFATREMSDLKSIDRNWLPKRPILPKPKSNEFLSIITSCKAYGENKMIEGNENKDLSHESQTENKISNVEYGPLYDPGDKETFLAGEINFKTPITLNALKKEIGIETKENKTKPNHNPFVNTNNEDIEFNNADNKKSYDDNKIDVTSVNKFQTSEIAICDTDIKKYNIAPIKERIHIPKKLWKRGATYKVEDCYYDYDGNFLYRVPGMTGKMKVQNN